MHRSASMFFDWLLRGGCWKRRYLTNGITAMRKFKMSRIGCVGADTTWGLCKKEVAALVGISEGVYMGLEKARNEYYEKDVVDKLAALFHIPLQDLLDEYNAFMYNDPAKKIREYRMSLGLGTERFARKIGTSDTCVRSWENNTKLISRKSWERCFKGKIK